MSYKYVLVIVLAAALFVAGYLSHPDPKPARMHSETRTLEVKPRDVEIPIPQTNTLIRGTLVRDTIRFHSVEHDTIDAFVTGDTLLSVSIKHVPLRVTVFDTVQKTVIVDSSVTTIKPFFEYGAYASRDFIQQANTFGAEARVRVNALIIWGQAGFSPETKIHAVAGISILF